MSTEPQTAEDTDPQPVGSPTNVRRGRRNIVGGSAHREEYARLIHAGWSAETLEAYAWHRYGEEISCETFRRYRRKIGADSKVITPFPEVADAQKMIDVASVRSMLIQLQLKRIGIDHGHETNMGKLFGSTRGEIDLVAKLLDQYKSDMQDLGLLPKAGTKLEVDDKRTGKAAEQEVPMHRSLAAALGAVGDEAELAKVLHLSLKQTGS